MHKRPAKTALKVLLGTLAMSTVITLAATVVMVLAADSMTAYDSPVEHITTDELISLAYKTALVVGVLSLPYSAWIWIGIFRHNHK